MEIFQRSIHSNVKKLEADRWVVSSDLLDLEHSIHLELTVRPSDGEILGARASMSKVPFERCRAARPTIEGLVGLRVERGILARASELVGGHRSCAHLMELVVEAVRLVGMMRVGFKAGYLGVDFRKVSEEEVVEALTPRLRNSCLVFADEE